ncbi:MAG: nucleoside recognition domain-containing protein [Bacillota bacterium]|nr:nucleoside recognition domain-containing protein [Bacillota bacterium]
MLTVNTFKCGFKKGIITTKELSKVIIPVYIIVSLLKETVIIDTISNILAPMMNLFGLPGEASIVLVLGNLINTYGAIGAMASFDLTIKQITIIAVMISFSHSLIIESTIIKKIGVNPFKVALMRISLSVSAGVLLNLLYING